jgi:signal transduction histidine kinase
MRPLLAGDAEDGYRIRPRTVVLPLFTTPVRAERTPSVLLMVHNERSMEVADADIARLSAEEFFHKFSNRLVCAVGYVELLALAVGQEKVADTLRELEVMRSMLAGAQTNNWLLAHDGHAQPMVVGVRQLLSIIREAVTTVSILADHHGAAQFAIDEQSFRRDATQVWTDTKLFQAALGNILDNARKYSFDDTTVRITARATRSQRLLVEVANVGIALRADEAKRCRERGWRSESALCHTDKGLGVGLWLTERIVRTIGASLLIQPTDAVGITRFSISMPTGRPHDSA